MLSEGFSGASGECLGKTQRDVYGSVYHHPLKKIFSLLHTKIRMLCLHSCQVFLAKKTHGSMRIEEHFDSLLNG